MVADFSVFPFLFPSLLLSKKLVDCALILSSKCLVILSRYALRFPAPTHRAPNHTVFHPIGIRGVLNAICCQSLLTLFPRPAEIDDALKLANTIIRMTPVPKSIIIVHEK